MVVDRIVGNVAVIEREDGTFLKLPLSDLPECVREGSVLVQNCEGYAVDVLATNERRKRSAMLTQKLFKKS